ncbi:MAG: protein translocase subunit SecF, partial [Ilumatobacteraceae bacterium]
MSTDVPAATAAPAFNNIDGLPPRRGRGGRLYHGETSIDFYGRRWWGLGLSIALIVITFGSLAVRGLNLGIDFEGGVSYEVPAQNFTVSQARDILSENGVNTDSAKIVERTSTAGKNILVQTEDQPLDKQQALRQALAKGAGVDEQSVSSSSVSSTWGSSITKKAVRALIIFLVLVALFIAWRFEWRMAMGAIVAMVHDVLISVGVYSVLGFEVTPATVVSFLTILGFSLYDTIVVFDKVKENDARFAANRVPYADVVNVSMNQVLMRSLNTSLAAVLPVLSLLILGAGIMGAVTLREFALALLVGLITGSYSSIFVATPLLAVLKEHVPKYRVLRGNH